MKKFIVILIVLFVSVNPLYSGDIELDPDLAQGMFEDFTKELGMCLNFAPMAPAETLGITGFDASAEILATQISSDEKYWEKVMDGDAPDYLPVPRLHVQKGLPFNIDVGAMYLSIPDSNIKLFGIECKYGLIEGNAVMPAVSVRGTYTQLTGVDDVALNTQTLDLMASKGLLMLTPYAGISLVRINASEEAGIGLESVNHTVTKYFIGAQFSPLPLFIVNVEASYGEIAQYGVKFGVRF